MSDTAAVRALRTMDLIPYILEHPGISINQLSKIFLFVTNLIFY